MVINYLINNNGNGDLVASFPVEESDQIMLVTDGGQLIRCPIQGISLLGRSTQGVTVFNTAEDENVPEGGHTQDSSAADEWRPQEFPQVPGALGIIFVSVAPPGFENTDAITFLGKAQRRYAAAKA